MAAIVPVYQQQVPQQAPQQVPQQFAASTAGLSGTSDPLFDALVKYVTSGPGPSAISQQTIQDILNEHGAQPGGRQYLESIVNPIGPTVWPNQGEATGFLSTNMTSLTLNFRAQPRGPGIPLVINFRGDAAGFFPIQPVCMFEDAPFYWGDQPPSGEFTFELENHTHINIVTVLFFNQVNVQSVDIPRTPIAELHIVPTTPLQLPPKVTGKGVFRNVQ